MSVSTDRLNYLDAVRAFALLLGIVFHASLSFMPIFIGWAVMDVSTSPLVPGFVLVSHSFRMELFFLIAGFFSHMTFHRKGAGAFISTRLTRIAVPFLAGWFILKPLIISGWVMGGQSMRGEVDIPNSLKTGFMALGELPRGLLVETHLWFLYYLLLVTALLLVTRFIVGLNYRCHDFIVGSADRAIRWLARSRFGWLALTAPTACCLWFMNGWGMDTPDKSLVPQPAVLLVYFGFFGFGWLLHRQQELMDPFTRVTPGRLALCVGSIAISISLAGYQADFGHPHIDQIRLGFTVSYALMMWSLAALSIGLFKRWFDQPSRAVRYLADASYWLYLVHLPLVIWLQIAVAELPFNWSIKLASIVIVTTGVSLLVYDGLVRPTRVGKLLNGRQKGRVLFRQRTLKLQEG